MMLSRFLERWYSTQDLTFFSLRGLSEIPFTLTVHPLKTQRTPTPWSTWHPEDKHMVLLSPVEINQFMYVFPNGGRHHRGSLYRDHRDICWENGITKLNHVFTCSLEFN